MENNLKQRKEKKIISTIVFCIDIWVIVLTLLTSFIKYWEKVEQMQIVWILTVCFITLLSIHYFKEKFILLSLRIQKSFTKSEIEMCGDWRIEIKYKNGNNSTEITRMGELKIVPSVLGLAIEGKHIRDSHTQATIIEEWTSEYVNLIETHSDLTIEYAFKIRRKSDKIGDYSKVGHVIVKSEDRKNFEGQFLDLLIPLGEGNDDEVKREGLVILQKV